MSAGNKRALDSPSPSCKKQKFSSRGKYEVFLSFRGEDTRNNFTDHLYNALKQNGIYTFRDDERLERGKEISSELLEAIESSRFSIVILSKNYASSTWCLEELAKIVECDMETEKSNIFPVFYRVDPSDVRKQRGYFKTAFDKHEQVFGDNLKKVERWRSALTQVANLSGFTVSKDRPESRLIEEIVRVISIKLNGPFPNIPKGFVGIESRLKNIFQLLEPESDDIRFIGICGMGGIGKTTIAEIVLNNLQHSYEGSCFLANVREVCGKDGAVALQKKLLSLVLKDTDPTISNVLQGRMLIESRLCRKKVFVVLDDVSNCHEQLDNLAGARDWFGPGSRIVITTRDEHVLISHKIIDEIYKVEALEDCEALELFGLKAFGQIPCPSDYLQLSEDIVHQTQGLPLALNILGSYLSGKTVDQWKSALKSFEDYPDVDIMKVLRISFDGLKPNEKDIFLDIACFFKGENKDQVIKILTSRGFHPVIGIESLIRKSLVTISDNIVSMHDLLQEMGWEIVREQHRQEPGKWTRLWWPDNVHHVLTENTGTENVEGIVVAMPKKGTSLNAKSFVGMKNLMLLKISNVDLSEDLEYLPNRLQYLEWHGCPLKNLPPNFQAQKLVELNLCYSQINYLWTGKKAFKELKTIKLSHSCNLIETPDFTEVPNLEMLDLEGCRILCKLHESVGSLRLLTVLNLKNCENLENFPSNIVDGLEALKILNLQGCSKLEKLPENLGELENLEELDAGRTAITQVPPSIVRLTNLKMLSFRGHRVKHNRWGTLVAAIAEFSSLVWPRRNRNFMGLSLPSLAGLFNLTKLDLSDCNLTDGALPNDLGSLCSLTVLNLSNNYFVSLPEIINQLSKLKMLCVHNCQNLRSLPELPSKLSFVLADDCPLLEDLSSMLRGGTSPNFTLHLYNCFKLLENHGQQNNLAVMLLKQYLQQPVNCTSLFDIPLLGSEIPEWFSCRSDGGSVAIGLPDNWLNDEFMGIAACGVFAPNVDLNYDHDLIDDADDVQRIIFGMSLNDNEYLFKFIIPNGFKTVKSDLFWLIYVSRLRFEHDYSYKVTPSNTSSDDSPDYNLCEIAPVSGSSCILAEFKREPNSKSKVIKCGIRLVYKQDVEDFQELPTTEGSTFHQNRSRLPAVLRRRGCPYPKLHSSRWITCPPKIVRKIGREIGREIDRDCLDIVIAEDGTSDIFRSNKHVDLWV